MGKNEKQKKGSWKVEIPIEESIDSDKDYSCLLLMFIIISLISALTH